MAFCQQYGLRIPILQAPMAGSCPVNLAVAVADAGGRARWVLLCRARRRLPNGPPSFARGALGRFN